eukprot:SAG11_NODE_11050_length_787_cov_0.748547_3_plen_24_part_01
MPLPHMNDREANAAIPAHPVRAEL